MRVQAVNAAYGRRNSRSNRRVRRMSHLNQIQGALERFFGEEGLGIVFWNDPDQEFFMTVTLLGQKVEGRHNPGPASVMPAGRRT
jgi:hypothetical protein